MTATSLAERDHASRPAGAPDPEDLSHVLRLLRLLITAVDYAGADGLRLDRDSALVGLARALVGRTGTAPHSSRTAVMALRDLVWRVDTARPLLAVHLNDAGRRELDMLLTTDDIHQFLVQEL